MRRNVIGVQICEPHWRNGYKLTRLLLQPMTAHRSIPEHCGDHATASHKAAQATGPEWYTSGGGDTIEVTYQWYPDASEWIAPKLEFSTRHDPRFVTKVFKLLKQPSMSCQLAGFLEAMGDQVRYVQIMNDTWFFQADPRLAELAGMIDVPVLLGAD